MKKLIKYDFTIITPGRSGSEHLSETLNNYEDIEMGGEVFNRTNQTHDSFNIYLNSSWWLRLISFFFNREKLSKLKTNFPLNYLIHSFLSIKQPFEMVRGFKLTLDQLDAYPMVFEILIGNNCKVIYLNREDRLLQVLSLMKARQTGIYHNRTEGIEDDTFTLDKELVKKQYLETKHREETLVKRLKGHPYLSLSYEQLFYDYELAIDKIREFLGLPKTSDYRYSNLKKTNRKSVDQLVDNLAEIKTILGD